MKNRPLISGIIAVASALPMFAFTDVWSMIWFFWIGMELLNYNSLPAWIQICAILPMLVSPLLGLGGLIHGIVKIKARRAWLGILLSVIGLAENFLLFFGIYYLSSRF